MKVDLTYSEINIIAELLDKNGYYRLATDIRKNTLPIPNNTSSQQFKTDHPEISREEVKKFTEEDLDNCWSHYKSYLIDILNGDYDPITAREDLVGLIGSIYDKRINTY